MSVLIKGKNMPKDCRECGCYYDNEYAERWCLITGLQVPCPDPDPDYNDGFDGRPDSCPLVEIPSEIAK